MGILAWIVVGLVAGWLAGLVMRGGGFGIVGDVVIGILGGLVGGFLAASLLGIPDAVNGINLGSILISFIGAVLLVIVIRAIPGRSAV